MTRGELYWVDFGVPVGSAAGFRRPALVPLVTALDKTCFIEKISSLPSSVVDKIFNAVIEIIH